MNKLILNTSVKKKLQEFLMLLGLDAEETHLFLILNTHELLTVLSLSRLTGINRTRVYRILEKLQTMGLIDEVIDQKRKMIRTVGVDTLEFLVKDQETKTKYLREIFPLVSPFLSCTKGNQSETKVLFYRGKEGIRQQVWNTLRTKGELVGYSYRPLDELIGDYYGKWYEEWDKRQLKMRDIYSDEYIQAKKQTLPIKGIQSRYISSRILNINHQVDIYNDVISSYNWYEGEVFGVEIYNEKIALMQKQLFEIVWKLAE